MKTFASRIADLSCPRCQAMQSLWVARLTLWNPVHGRMNAFFMCECCQARLRLNREHVGLMMVVFGVLTFALCLTSFLILFTLALKLGSGTFQVVPLAILALIITQLIGMYLNAHYAKRNYILEIAP